jgi:uncharacterized membrane protein
MGACLNRRDHGIHGGKEDSLEPKLTDVTRVAPRWPRLTALAVALAVFIITLFIVVPPHTLLGKADVIGYSICHRIVERSFILGGRPLPLCARCTGTFLGAVLGLATLLVLRRQRAARMPPPSVLGLLVLFVGFWAFDGLNSYLTLFPGAPHLYEPQNWLRLTTGLLNGLALVTFVLPILSFTLWREPSPERVFRSIWEVLALIPVVAALVLVTQTELDVLLYPLAILSALGVLLMLVLINTLIATVILGREGYAQTWRQALVPLTVGAALAVLQITTMILIRAYLTVKLGLPF